MWRPIGAPRCCWRRVLLAGAPILIFIGLVAASVTGARFIAVSLVAILLVGALATAVLGAEPSPAPLDPFLGGDPRSEGSGPGFVSNPLVILLGVVALGAVTVALTVVLARLGRRA